MTVTAEELSFGYPRERPVLRNLNLRVEAGEFVAVTGTSGSGKSTLLLCLAGILQPSGGRIEVAGRRMAGSADDRAEVRRRHIGLVFQFSELIAELTLRDNVSLPLELLGMTVTRARAATDTLLEELGLQDVATQFPGQVSGGQAQRAAVARALIHGPAVVLADEPTGALDEANADRVLELLSRTARARGSALVVVTHDSAVASRADRVLPMSVLDATHDPVRPGQRA